MPADPTPDLPSSVFVYGTLMPDERYSGVASAAGAPERAERATLPGFVLHHLSPEGYPAVTPGAGTVHGWVLHYAPGTWAAALAHLDDLEGLHLRPPLYRRVPATPVTDAGTGRAWVYVYAREARLAAPGAVPVPSGRWTDVPDRHAPTPWPGDEAEA